MSQKNSLSAIVIAKNESVRIGACVDALSFCDHILVADNGSTDQTAEIAKLHGATVVTFHTGNFAKLRNEALEKSQGEWVVYVDADEVISKALALNIRATLASWHPGKPTAYELNRINYYLGVRWPGSEWMLRCFRKDSSIRWHGEIHETPVTTGTVGRISGELRHDTHRSLEEMVTKTNEWSETEAELRLAAHHPKISWWRLLRVTLTGFMDTYIGQSGWRAGTVGWIESIYQGFSLFITYAKLWEMQRNVKQQSK